jgi:hypothetical protein
LEIRLERAATPDIGLRSVLQELLDAEEMVARDRLLVLELWLQAARNPKVRAILDRARSAWRGLLVVAFTRAQDGAPEAAADLALALHHGLLAQACLDGAPSATLRDRAATALAVLVAPTALRRTA